jgi:HK97 family phage portal protein
VGLIESITRGAANFRADISGTPAPWDDYWYNPLGTGSAAGVRISAETVKGLASVLACVNIISRNVAMMPCKIFTYVASGGKKVVPHHPIYDLLLSRPNPRHTAFEWFQIMQGWYELRGNAYSEIVPGKRGAVDQLLPMHPDRVKVEKLSNGRLRYVYDDPLTSRTRNLVEEEVFHLRNWSDDGAVGQSTIAMAKDVFGVGLAQQDYSARFLKNDATSRLVLTGTNLKNKQDQELLRESWQSAQTGANRHKTAILPVGVDVKTISVSPKDALLLDSRKFSRIEICSIFGVPPHLIGETEKTATYASVEQFNIMFAVQCILPRLVNWEQTIQRDLILDDRYFAKFSMAALMRGDNATRANFYMAGFNNGWFNQDDIREMEDLNPTDSPGAQTYFRSANIVPLEQVTAPAPVLPEDEDDEESETADPETDPSADDGEQPEAAARLRLMASSAADRCVRKEIAALRRLGRDCARAEEISAFYDQHSRFVAEVMKLDVAAVRKHLEFYERGFNATKSPIEFLNGVALTAPAALLDLAMKGSK